LTAGLGIDSIQAHSPRYADLPLTYHPVPHIALAQDSVPRAVALDLAARGLHELPQRSVAKRPRIAAALHWHRTPATGALIFLFQIFLFLSADRAMRL